MMRHLLKFRWLLGVIAAMFASACSSPPSRQPPSLSDPLYQQASAAGRSAFEQGQLQQSAAMYRQALVRARATNWPEAIVDAAYNLAVCELATQHFAEADAVLAEAIYSASLGGLSDRELRLLQAKSAYLQGQWANAIRFCGEVTSRPGDVTQALAAIVLKGQAQCELGDVSAARAQLQSAATQMAKLSSAGPSLQADIENLRGKIARLEKNDAAAAGCFDREAEFLRAARRYRDMSHALARAAESHLAANRPSLAADRYFLAGRSIAAQGDRQQGIAWLDLSMKAAEKAHDAEARARADAMLKELVGHVPPRD